MVAETGVNPNQAIYEKFYTGKHLALTPQNVYELELKKLRLDALEKYGTDRDVVDLCCGSGTYSLLVLDKVRTLTGVDFSSSLLKHFQENLPAHFSDKTKIIQTDARALPLASSNTDFVFSIASLYYIPQVDLVVNEVHRILKPGGTAFLEFGNFFSINTLFSFLWYKEKGWAKPSHISLKQLRSILHDGKWEILDWRCFQFLPLYRPPTALLFLYPFTGAHLKKILGIKIKGRMLDDWISTFLLPFMAFRHTVTLRKK